MSDYYDQDDLESWIERVIHEHIKPLTPWERTFLESISDQLARMGHLSDRQVEKLKELVEEKTR